MNDTINAIINRRSIYNFNEKKVRDEDVEDILQAGLYALSAGC